MKALKAILLAAIPALIWTACSNSNAEDRYIDLSTGQPVELVKDEQTGLMVNAETHKPVRMYVDTKTQDTVWGKSGKVVNGFVEKNNDGVYVYINPNDSESDYKAKSEGNSPADGGNYKVKVEKDGDYKIKTDDKKIKVDAETGKTKVKKD
jgi:hypothetical protein